MEHTGQWGQDDVEDIDARVCQSPKKEHLMT